MTPALTNEDIFMPTHLLPASLQAKAKKRPLLFTGTLSFLQQLVKLKMMDPEHGRQAEEKFYEYFRHFYEQIERVPKGYERGLAIMQAMDLIMKKAENSLPDGKKLSCKKNCSHCCHMRVSVSDSEADVMVSHIKRLGLTLERGRLLAQQNLVTENYPTLSWEDRACPLLSKDGSCSIYQWRPTACRKYAVVSPPEMCDGRIHKTAWLVSDMMAEAFSAALLALEQPEHYNDRNLSYQLLRRIPESSTVWR